MNFLLKEMMALHGESKEDINKLENLEMIR